MSACMAIGADRGIGRSIVEQWAARGERTIAVCLGNAAFDGDVTVIPNVDVTNCDSISGMVAALKSLGVKLGTVVHVAGVLGVDELGKIDYADVTRQFEINAIGPLRAIEAVLPFLAEGAKVGIITSRVGSLQDNASGSMYAYRASKAAANMIGLNLHHDLSKQGMPVLMLHPGMVATDLTKDFPGDFDYITPEQAASGLIRNMDNLTLENSGKFQHANGEWLPW